jgi:hypothetical protein
MGDADGDRVAPVVAMLYGGNRACAAGDTSQDGIIEIVGLIVICHINAPHLRTLRDRILAVGQTPGA